MSEALSKISESAFCVAIKENKFDVASALMPKTYSQVQEQPKVREMIEIAGVESVQSMIEYELLILASLMSVGGNLNKAQVPFIAEQLIELYPNESIADFKLCFKKGSIGEYGDIQRLDGITIGQWMKAYLDAKYEAIVNDMMKEKEVYNRPIIPESEKELTPEDPEYYWHDAWLENLQWTLKNAVSTEKKVSKLTQEEIEEEGQVKPKVKPYPYTPKVLIEESERHHAWIVANHDPYTGKPKPGYMEEEVWLREVYYAKEK